MIKIHKQLHKREHQQTQSAEKDKHTNNPSNIKKHVFLRVRVRQNTSHREPHEAEVQDAIRREAQVQAAKAKSLDLLQEVFFTRSGEHADFLFEEEDTIDVHVSVDLADFKWSDRMHKEFKKVSDEDLTKIRPVGKGWFSDSYEHEQSPHFEFSHSGDRIRSSQTHVPKASM